LAFSIGVALAATYTFNTMADAGRAVMIIG